MSLYTNTFQYKQYQIQDICTARIVYPKNDMYPPGLLQCSLFKAQGSSLCQYPLQLPVGFFYLRVYIRPCSSPYYPGTRTGGCCRNRCINNTGATVVIVYFCPQRQYKMCVNIDPSIVVVQILVSTVQNGCWTMKQFWLHSTTGWDPWASLLTVREGGREGGY